MNKFLGIGIVVADPDVRYAQNENNTCVARYRIAINRKFNRDGQNEADFISCVAFGRNGEFAEKFLKKGMKIGIEGRIQTGSYTNNDGNKVYTTDIVVEAHDFCEKKSENPQPTTDSDGFMNVPDGIEEELPFN